MPDLFKFLIKTVICARSLWLRQLPHMLEKFGDYIFIILADAIIYNNYNANI